MLLEPLYKVIAVKGSTLSKTVMLNFVPEIGAILLLGKRFYVVIGVECWTSVRCSTFITT